MNNRHIQKLGAVLVAVGVAGSAMAAETVIRPGSITVSGASTLFPAENLINGSGLNAPLNSGDSFAAGINHDWNMAVDADSWVSTDPGGFPADYFTVGGIPAFTFDLSSDALLNMAHFWAYGGSSGVAGTVQGNSARTIELRFNSAAAGNANFLGPVFTFELNHGPSFGGAPGNILPSQDFFLGEDVTARYVQMLITDNWYVSPGDGSGTDVHGDFVRGGDRVGLGEVRFGLNPVPEPGTYALLGLGLATVILLRRRTRHAGR